MEGEEVMHTRRNGILAFLFAIALPCFAQQQPPAAPAKPKPKRTPSAGELVFQQNCSRCHNAPQGFSPRISGTIVRHMRVRASLSKKDEEALLRFFNP
jgi:mono/diheme cytochrome c family protein